MWLVMSGRTAEMVRTYGRCLQPTFCRSLEAWEAAYPGAAVRVSDLGRPFPP